MATEYKNLHVESETAEGLSRYELLELVHLQGENIIKGDEERNVLIAENARLEHDLKVATEMIVDLNSVIDTYVKMFKRVC